MKENLKEYLEFKAHQSIKSLFKDFIRMLEDLYEDEIIDREDFIRYRKRVLDRGNDAIRNLSKELEVLTGDGYNKE